MPGVHTGGDPMITLSQIVAALSATYTDSGVAMWLAARNSGLGGAAPIDVIARDPLDGLRRVADLVSRIGDADPTDAEERPEDASPDVPAARDDEPRGFVDAATIYACFDAGHDVGLRHEDGALYSATCHDCGHRYHRNCPPVPAARDEPEQEPLSPEFRAALIAAVGRPLRVRSHILLLAAHATGHLVGADRGCRVCHRDWPCEDVQRAAAPALEAFADDGPGPVQVTTPEDKS